MRCTSSSETKQPCTRVGYARAGRLVDEMTLRGITAEAEGPTKPRTVLISREEWRRMQENQE